MSLLERVGYIKLSKLELSTLEIKTTFWKNKGRISGYLKLLNLKLESYLSTPKWDVNVSG